MYYLLLLLSALLFSSQFLFNKKYQEENGSGLECTIHFAFYTAIISAFVIFAVNGFKFQFSVFSLLMASAYAILTLIYTYSSICAFKTANISTYSVFAMLGGMLLPFITGIVYFGEEITIIKCVSCLLIVCALFFGITDNSIKSGLKHYLLVFFLNGSVGVISQFHQASSQAVDSNSFLIMSRLVTIFIVIVASFILHKRIEIVSFKSVLFASGFAIFNGMGNLILLVALNHVDASVQFPIITGGTMVFAALIDAVRHEKLAKNTIISTTVTLIATMLLCWS